MTANTSALTTQDSHETKEMYCEECEKHGDGYTPAVAFCVDCVEYKCVTCRKYHKRQSKTHKIQNYDSMPQDFYFEKCSTHTRQLIKFYCSVCSKEACQECKDNEHVKCSDVNHLPILASGIQNSYDLKDLQQNLDKLYTDIKYIEKLLEAKSEVVDKQEEKAIEACKEHADKLKEAFKQHHQDVIDALDKKIEETIARLKKQRLELVQELSEKERKFKNKITKAETGMKEEVVSLNKEFKVLRSEHFTSVENLRALTADLEQAQKLGQNCKLFIKLKITEQLCENLRQNLDQIHQACILCFKVKPSNIQPTELSLESETRFFTFKKVSALERNFVFNFDINSPTDHISSLLVLSEHTLIKLYWTKCCLVIYKLEKSQAKCIDDIKFNTSPWHIAKVLDNKVAVTFQNERMIKIITFSEDIKVLDITEIPGNGYCTGIAYIINQHLVVSYWNPASIKILSMSGKIVKTFDNHDYGQDMFIEPWYIIVSPDNTLIYVSDWYKHTVTCLTIEGEVKAVFIDDQLKIPRQLAVDEYGSIYVSGAKFKNIHQLSSDLTEVQILSNKSHGLNQPESVAFCQNTKRLFVGLPNKIKVFQVSHE
jgi:hypothetical protein